jgi:YHS domain-containing protein
MYFHKLGLLVYWFCSLECRRRFLDSLGDKPQREYMETGGWQ